MISMLDTARQGFRIDEHEALFRSTIAGWTTLTGPNGFSGLAADLWNDCVQACV